MVNMGLNCRDGQCCGCSACADICPKNAIEMLCDKNGFLVPVVNENSCIGCKQCQRVCQFITPIDLFEPIDTYAAVCKENDVLIHSASGGVFYSLANSVLKGDGVVIGCAYEETGSELSVQHIIVQNAKDLKRIQGSKYVQSNTLGIYKQVKRLASHNRLVLFSGTPCQVAACRSYLGDGYENVVCVDIICHGVPSQEFFKGYISYLEKKHNIKIDEVLFRDKSKGWDLRGSLLYNKKSIQYKKSFRTGGSSYYALFLQAQTYRESCYTCPYAGKYRCGDITIGDFWGIKRVHPEFLKRNGGAFEEDKGISCVIVNTPKGASFLQKYGKKILMKESDFSSVAKNNAQLREPSKKGKERDEIINLFNNQGYEELDKRYRHSLGPKRFMYWLYDLLPPTKV